MLKPTLFLMLIICLTACASGPSTQGSGKSKSSYVSNESTVTFVRERLTSPMNFGLGAYTGSWEYERPEGEGTFIAESGRTYIGLWAAGKPHGTGRMTYEPGSSYSSYEGQWDQGNFNGNGKLIKSNDDVLEGIFRWGKLHGRGVYRYANGDIYEGEFHLGKKNGHGTLTLANGEATTEHWVHGYTPSEFQAKVEADTIARREASAEAQRIRAVAQEKREQQRISDELEREQSKIRDRLLACDSFGFERGTDSHAECAMQLYINEQNQATSSQALTQKRGQRQADLEQQKRAQEALLASQRQEIARQEAIQEAILKEQERVRRMEQSMKLIELGTGIATGSLGARSTPKMQSHTYTINGQIINCTTTGSVTNCF